MYVRTFPCSPEATLILYLFVKRHFCIYVYESSGGESERGGTGRGKGCGKERLTD
jgi:hypothetical protein